jgi:hypothetical protein
LMDCERWCCTIHTQGSSDSYQVFVLTAKESDVRVFTYVRILGQWEGQVSG